MNPAIVGGLVSGGFKLLGGILGRKQAKEDMRMQFVRLRKAAERGGFNPLTVLRANPQAGLVGGGLASNNFLADAADSGFQTYFNQKAQEKDPERDMLEKALMREELANMQAQGKALHAAMNFGYAPIADNFSGVDRVGAVPALSASDGPRSISGDPLRVANVDVVKNEAFSDAQKIEDRYGDVASWIYGLGTVAGDAYSTVRKFNVPFLSTPWGDIQRAKDRAGVKPPPRRPAPRPALMDQSNFPSYSGTNWPTYK